jgi:hypothetical protein
MEIVNVRSVNYLEIEVSGMEWQYYYRYSADNWAVMMGQSLEPVYNERILQELEAAYQSKK